MPSFELEVIFANIFKKQACILATFNNVLTTSVRFIKSNRFCTFTRQSSVYCTPTYYAKMVGNNERLIQFWLSLYPMSLFPRTPFYCKTLKNNCFKGFTPNKICWNI